MRKKEPITMSVAEYAASYLYKNKKITTARVWQLIKDGKLTLQRKNPALVIAEKV